MIVAFGVLVATNSEKEGCEQGYQHEWIFH
jgi:hypothetical protein